MQTSLLSYSIECRNNSYNEIDKEIVMTQMQWVYESVVTIENPCAHEIRHLIFKKHGVLLSDGRIAARICDCKKHFMIIESGTKHWNKTNRQVTTYKAC